MDDRETNLIDIDRWPRSEKRGRLLHEIEEAQKHMVPGWKSRKWAQRLRFLVDLRSTESNSGNDFKLITDGIDSTEPYVAVSYCWTAQTKKTGKARTFQIEVPSATNPGATTVRKNRARAEVLVRSFKFATAHGIKKVWIDQECIDQNDRVDKELGIQSMDLVYRRAGITLVLLGRHVETITEAERILVLSHPSGRITAADPPDDVPRQLQLSKQRDGSLTMPYPQSWALTNEEFDDLMSMFSSVGRLLGDKWFTRAWTTQEFIVTNDTSLVFLVGWDESGDDDEALQYHLWDEFFRQPPTRTLLPYSITRREYRAGAIDVERANEHKVTQLVPGEWMLREEDVMSLAENLIDLIGDMHRYTEERLYKKPHDIFSAYDLIPWSKDTQHLFPIGTGIFGRDSKLHARELCFLLPELDTTKLNWVGTSERYVESS